MNQLARDMLREVAKAAKKQGRRKAVFQQLRKVKELLNGEKAPDGSQRLS